MKNLERDKITWLAGLFEGEGSFCISKDKAKAISIPSTDLDILKRVQDYVGGDIYELTKRKSHWKDAWIWSIRCNEAIKFAELIKPYLLSRRNKRCEEWLYLRNQMDNKKYEHHDIIIQYLQEGLNQTQIANKLGKDRSTISKYIKKHNITPK